MASPGLVAIRENATKMTAKQSSFDQRKTHTLRAIFDRNADEPASCDKSLKGFVDTRALPIITLINSHTDMFTTSSCSGRIVLYGNRTGFIYTSHNASDEQDVVSAFNASIDDQSVDFKMEPFVLHVECRDMNTAQFLIKVALASGYRNTGCVFSALRIIVMVRSTLKMDIPVVVDGKRIASPEQLGIWSSVANDKMVANLASMERLEASLQSMLGATASSTLPSESDVSKGRKALS